MLLPRGHEMRRISLPVVVEDVGGEDVGGEDVGGEDVGGGALEPSSTSVRSAPHVRVVRVHQGVAEALVPTAFACATYVVAGDEYRVLDPAAISIEVLGVARAKRPVRLRVVVRDAQEGDDLHVFADGRAVGLSSSALGPGGLVVQLESLLLDSSSVALTVVHEGRRDGRHGKVEVRATLHPGPAPRIDVEPSLRGGAFVRALALQGYDVDAEVSRATDPSPTDPSSTDVDVTEPVLFLRSLAKPPGEELRRRIDAGTGLLLVAERDASVDPQWCAWLPIVKAPDHRPGPAEAESGGGAATITSADKVDDEPKEHEVPPSPSRPTESGDGLRRTGDVGAEEIRTANDGRKTIATRAVALVFLVDVSGSMSGPVDAPAIEEAKRAALETAATLGPGDSFALVTFGTDTNVELPLGKASRRDDLELAIRRLTADASATRAYLALQSAWSELKRSDAPVRHVLLLTDGEFTDSALDYRQLVRAMHREGIGFSAIGSASGGATGLSTGKFRFLQRVLAEVGGHVRVTTSNELARLVLGEVREVLTSARPLAEGGRDSGRKPDTADEDPKPKPADPPAPEPPTGEPPAQTPEAADPPNAPSWQLRLIEAPPILEDFAERGAFEWPSLSGAAPLEATERARVHLAFASTGRLALATSLYGLGRVVVWAGDDGAQWSRAFATDERFPAFVARLAAWAEAIPTLEDSESRVPQVSAITVTDRLVLEGDGLSKDALDDVAQRVAGVVATSLEAARSRAPASIEEAIPGGATPMLRIGLVLACALLLVALEALLARRRSLRGVVARHIVVRRVGRT
ncbi:MAG: VWA domain-containing protein [Planctomycetes bacterium]|nr:VWA domain-containing protein [Planctomycetota bacterium]MCB9918857.1 VWA domain-containing protein [Planctomycetota bacterium]